MGLHIERALHFIHALREGGGNAFWSHAIFD